MKEKEFKERLRREDSIAQPSPVSSRTDIFKWFDCYQVEMVTDYENDET